MHLMRVFRSVCLFIVDRDKDAELLSSQLVNPSKINAFSALYKAYHTAKNLVKQYGNVRVYNAEVVHRPKGEERVRKKLLLLLTCFIPRARERSPISGVCRY